MGKGKVLQSVNPLQFAHNEAKRNDLFLKNAFARYLGNSQHPRGKVLSIYRQGRKNMQSALRTSRFQIPLEVDGVLSQMRYGLMDVSREVIRLAANRGNESGRLQAEAYTDNGLTFDVAADAPQIDGLIDSFLEPFETQANSIRAMVRSGLTDEARILGDGGRLGTLQPNPLITGATELITGALVAGLLAWWIGRDKVARPGFQRFQKQAIAVIDEKTTDCCLQVNGQVRDFDKDFHLTGTPRFADFQEWSPFHYNCRTTIALYDPSFDFGITAQIEEAARKEREKRKSTP